MLTTKVYQAIGSCRCLGKASQTIKSKFIGWGTIMKLAVFKEGINKTEKMQRARYKDQGICGSLIDGFGLFCNFVPVKRKFFVLFRPLDRNRDIDGVHTYWLGNLNKENLQRRIDTLRFFEQVCITEKHYKEF